LKSSGFLKKFSNRIEAGGIGQEFDWERNRLGCLMRASGTLALQSERERI
jgi:hypothetical protein